MNRLISKIQKEKDVFLIIIASKLAIFIIIFLAYNLLPFAKTYYFANFVYPPNEPISLISAYKTWDGHHYLFLSEQGYKTGNISNSFTPLFPFLIRLTTTLTGSSFVSGFLISNSMSLIGFYLFYVFVNKLYGKKVAYKSLLFLLAFPVSFYFSLIYTESVFFLLIMLYFLFLFKKNYLAVFLIGILLPLERFIGLFVIIPSLYYYFFIDKRLIIKSQVIDFVKNIQKKIILLFGPLIGFAIHLLFMYWTTGDLFEQFRAATLSVSQPSISYMFHPSRLFTVVFNSSLTLHGFNNSIIDRIFFFLFLFLLPIMYKRLDKTFFLHSIITGLFFIFIGVFMSYTRHLLIVFPIFILLGIIVNEKKYSFLQYPLLFSMIMLQSLFLIMHSLNYWVA